MEFNFNQDPQNPNFDENGNLIYKNQVSVQLGEICSLSSSKKRALKALAIVVLVLFLVGLLILAYFTVTDFENF